MPVMTDRSVSPYFDDFSESKDFSQILFKPGPAIQVRELNQLQSILQSQIERFGDNIFKRGTIIDGCQFAFYDNYRYVKLKDTDSSGEAINVNNFLGLFVTDESTGVTARIDNTIAGFEATAPDLNTIYVSYIKAGVNGELSFSSGSNLVVTDLDRTINSIEVLNNVSGFSNTDVVVFTPAIVVQNSAGGTAFANGANFVDVLTAGKVLTQNLISGEAKSIIVSANASLVNSSVVISLRPLTNSLTGNAFSNGLFRVQNSFQANTTIPASSNGAEVFITKILGSGVSASVITNTSGRVEDGINSIRVNDSGSEYIVRPHVTIASGTANTSQIDSLQITPRNFYARVEVANSSSNAIGTGYAFAVSDGVIYQKGMFSRVSSQLTIVEKYNNLPDKKSVGFDTIEQIVNSNSDFSLLDIANTKNATAPGADRLKVTPTLITLTSTEVAANSEFFSIVEFAQGNPFKQIQDTRYNAIEAAMEKRTYEQSGDYVLDQFLVNSVSQSNALLDSTTFNVVVDPGTAYIRGRRVETSNNFVISVNKSTDTKLSEKVNIDINIGNFVDVKGVGGTFPTSKMVTVQLYDTAANYYNLAAGSTPVAVGNIIGTARIRAVTYTDGILGSPEATFRAYLFDVKMNPGRGFDLVKSIFYNGTTYKAVADVAGPSVIREAANNLLVFPTKSLATKTLSSANIEFTVRSSQANVAANGLSSGSTIIVAAGPDARFSYAGVLTDAEMRDIIITPNATIRSNTNTTGTVTGTAGQANLVGTGTSFVVDAYAGGYFRIGAETVRVKSVTNNTHLALSSNLTTSFVANTLMRELPSNVPVNLIDLPGAIVTVSANTSLQIGLGFVSQTPSYGVSITYNKLKNQSSSAASKTTRRKAYVKIDVASHPANTVGPWCLGMPDAFRLRAVYRGANTSAENITTAFYIDNNQTENYLDHSYLITRPGAKFDVNPTDTMLVEFDVFQNPADRPFTIDSYSVNDTVEFDVANTTIHTAEIPQFYGIRNTYFDLRDQIDFRPAVVSTANVLATVSTATVNPSEARVFDETLDKNVPAPQSDLRFNVESYQARADRVVMTSNGDITVLRGQPSSSYNPAEEPQNSITVDVLNIPPYPSIPFTLNENISKFYDTKIGSERLLTDRFDTYKILSSPKYKLTTAQNRRYTMADVAKMDRKVDELTRAVSLTSVEQKLDDLVIPSSLDENIARFKFGFAVDNFEGLRLSDTTNPQFNATIFGSRLSPKKKLLQISYVEDQDNRVLTLPREGDYTVISQNIATDGKVVLPEPPAPPIPVVPPVTPVVVIPTPPPVVTPPPPPTPRLSVLTFGDRAHICGITPGTIVTVEVRHPVTRDIYSVTEAIASAEGCVNADLIYLPPPPLPDPIVVTPPYVAPVIPYTPPLVIEVTPTPPPVVEEVAPIPQPPVVLPIPEPYNEVPTPEPSLIRNKAIKVYGIRDTDYGYGATFSYGDGLDIWSATRFVYN